MKMLYVEDNRQDADLVRRTLARQAPEIELEVVPTLKMAFGRLAQKPACDLVLTDLNLPDGSGLELLAYIRAHALPLAVVVLTGSGDHDSAIAALKSGADDYLTKRKDFLSHLPQTLAGALARFQSDSVRKAQPLRVLYAEHNSFDIDLTRRHLALHTPHIRLDVVNNASEVLALLPQHSSQPLPCDVLLLDYRLPGIDALEAIKVLRNERGLFLPIVLVTGQGSESVTAQALHLGVDDYLTKHAGYLFELPATLEKVHRQALLERKQEALQESLRRYDELTARIPSGVFRFRICQDGSQRFDYVSARLCDILGLDRATLLADIRMAYARVHPDDLPGFVQAIENSRRMMRSFIWEGRFCGPGVVRWMRIESEPLALENGDIVWDGMQRDITESRQVQQLQLVRNAVLGQINAGQCLPAILNDIVKRLEAIRPEMCVSIMLIDPQTGLLNIACAPSLPDSFKEATSRRISAPGMESCHYAAYQGELVVVTDIATHPSCQNCRDIAARAGFGAFCSQPFKNASGQVLGVFGIYYTMPHQPAQSDLDLISEFARITALAVQTARDEAIRLQSEQRFRATFEQSTLLMGIVAQDGALMMVNSAALALIGAQEPDVVGKPFWDTPWWQGNPPQQTRLREALACAGSGQSDHFEAVHLAQDGKTVVIEFMASPIHVGNSVQILVSGLDITDRKRTEDALRQSATVFASTRDGVMIVDLDVRIESVNPAFSDITGYSLDEVLGQNPSLLQSGRQDRSFYQSMWASLHEAGYWQGEVWNRRKNGEVYPEWLTISTVLDEHGQPARYVGVFSDITLIRQSEAKLEHLAHYDALTQLPNRLLLFSRLEHSLEVALRDGKKLALLMLDLDHFKDINDSLGHLAGDELLQQVAQRLSSCVRGMDTVCRLGGDEFTVVLDEITQPEDAAHVANHVIAALSEPWQLSTGVEVRISASVGISLFPDHGKTAADLLQQADTSLYLAKSEGRGCFKYFSEDLTRAVRARIELESSLRHAIENNELRVFYQPQVDMASGRIIGAEALVRWQDPVKGLIMPAQFIPLAEETGLITPLGNWVLKETCRQGQCWIEAGLPPLTLAVNLSAHQFLHSNIQEVVAEVLAETGFPAQQLELELTESALMAREDDAIRILGQLRALGVRLAIDDFGTGYSSLAYLKRFPLDVLKVDKSFIDDIPYGQDDMAITSTIIVMAHTLRLKVLAEGVETVEQLDFLQQQGCNLYQGYLTSPPIPGEAFEKMISAAGSQASPEC